MHSRLFCGIIILVSLHRLHLVARFFFLFVICDSRFLKLKNLLVGFPVFFLVNIVFFVVVLGFSLVFQYEC